MKTILFPTDFSVCSKHALSYALKLCDDLFNRIIVLHIKEPEMKFEEKYLQEVIDQIKSNNSKIKVKVISSYLNLHLKINELIEEESIDLIVMGTEGIGKRQKNAQYGSNTVNVINQCHCSVIAVPAFSEISSPKRIVFATDLLGNNNTESFNSLKLLGEKFKSKMVILNVLTPNAGFNQLSENAKSIYNKLFQKNKLEYQQIKAENIVVGIKEFCREYKADIVSMIPTGHHTGLLQNGSNTIAMSLYSNLPLLALYDTKRNNYVS